MMAGDMVAALALQQVGTAFRVHGRQPGLALDCVGLTAHALQLRNVPADYSLKGCYLEIISGCLDGVAGQQISTDTVPCAGDVALVQCAPRHHHLMIHAAYGWVHAHAGLRRVVHMPGASPWPIIALWRICGE
jgi:murein DD-endopeptidase / murein LD-carboxypeptidase